MGLYLNIDPPPLLPRKHPQKVLFLPLLLENCTFNEAVPIVAHYSDLNV